MPSSCWTAASLLCNSVKKLKKLWVILRIFVSVFTKKFNIQISKIGGVRENSA